MLHVPPSTRRNPAERVGSCLQGIDPARSRTTISRRLPVRQTVGMLSAWLMVPQEVRTRMSREVATLLRRLSKVATAPLLVMEASRTQQSGILSPDSTRSLAS